MDHNPYESPQFGGQSVLEGYAIEQHERWNLASRVSRWLAQFLDGIIMSVISFAFFFTVLMFAGERLIEETDPIALQLVLFGLYIGTYLALNCYLLATNGQTLGKKIVGIKIVRTNGEPATLGRIVGLRFLPIVLISVIPGIGALVSLADVLMIFRQNRKCWHDDLADTIVIRA